MGPDIIRVIRERDFAWWHVLDFGVGVFIIFGELDFSLGFVDFDFGATKTGAEGFVGRGVVIEVGCDRWAGSLEGGCFGVCGFGG